MTYNKIKRMKTKMVSQIVAAIASFIIPGLGQALAGDIKKGAIYFVIAIIMSAILIMLLGMGNPISYISIIYNIYTAYDAYNMVK